MAIEFESLFIIIGETVVYITFFLLLVAILGSLLIVYSFKTEKFIFPGFMLFAITLLENLVKALFRLINMDDSIVDDVGIALKNKISMRKFRNTPVSYTHLTLPTTREV